MKMAQGINILTVIGLGLVVASVVIGVGADIIVSTRNSITTCTIENSYLSINNGSRGITNLAKQMPTVGTVGGAIAILGLVMSIGR